MLRLLLTQQTSTMVTNRPSRQSTASVNKALQSRTRWPVQTSHRNKHSRNLSYRKAVLRKNHIGFLTEEVLPPFTDFSTDFPENIEFFKSLETAKNRRYLIEEKPQHRLCQGWKYSQVFHHRQAMVILCNNAWDPSIRPMYGGTTSRPV